MSNQKSDHLIPPVDLDRSTIVDQSKNKLTSNDKQQSTINDQESTMNSISGSPPRLYLLYGIIIIQSVIFLSEMIIDQAVHSMLILADAYHHLFNSFNAILLVVCYKISNQQTLKNTFGWVRTELLGMLTTITFIVALIFSLLIEGALQLLHLHEISGPTNPRVLIIFGVWSLLVNILYVLVINGVVTDKKYKQTTKNERSFSTAKCQQQQEESTDKTITCKAAKLNNNKIKKKNQTKKSNKKISKNQQSTSVGVSFPRTGNLTYSDDQLDLSASDQSELDHLHLDSSLIDEVFRVEFTESSTNSSGQSEPSSSATSESMNCFCQSFIQGILSPCFVIFCSFLITILNKSSFGGEQFDVEMIDPLIGIITAISLCITFYPQLKNTFLILMQTVPQNVNINQLKKELLEKFQVIQNIHEFHIWLLTGSNIVVTCHIVLPPQNTHQYSLLFEEIKSFLQTKYGIRYITIQPEFNTKMSYNEKPDQLTKLNPDTTAIRVRKHSSNCLNQCLVKCPCDIQTNQCEMKSCCSMMYNEHSDEESDNVHQQQTNEQSPMEIS